jgi:HK97 gp10 family phage protein
MQVIEDKQLVKNIEALEKSVTRKIMRPSVAAGLRPIRAEARRLVPVRTGAMKKSIGIKAWCKKSRSVGKVYIRHNVELAAAIEGKKYSPDAVAHIVEFGSKTAAPHPFMYPAKENKKAQSMAAFAAAAKLNYEKVVHRELKKGKKVFK